MSGLLGASDIRRIAAEIGVNPTKQWGQNFVIDANTVRRIVRTSEVGPDDVVVEVGPGLGSLTLALLEVVAHVVAIEIDPVLAARLPQTVAEQMPGAESRLTILGADALRVGVSDVRAAHPAGLAPTAMVANLPYNVSVPVLLHLWDELPSLEQALVMVQAEVADRLSAGPGSKIYGVPSLKIRWYCTPTRAGSVGPSVFWPAPNVDSGLVYMKRHDQPGDEALRREVFRVIDAAFLQRRKTLRSALAGWAGSPDASESILRAADVAPSARGEVLGLEDFVRIALAGRRASDASVGDVGSGA